MMKTKEEILEADKELLDLVVKYDYYLSLLDRKDELSEIQDIRNFWGKFWGLLPDSMAIRREPFFKLCDIIEDCDEHLDEAQELDDEFFNNAILNKPGENLINKKDKL